MSFDQSTTYSVFLDFNFLRNLIELYQELKLPGTKNFWAKNKAPKVVLFHFSLIFGQPFFKNSG